VVVAADRSIFVVGPGILPDGSTYGFAVARLTPTGVLDPQFGSGGRTFAGFNTPEGDGAQSVAIQPDGRIVVGGGPLSFLRPSSPGYQAEVARFLPSGALDSTFGAEGVVKFSNADNGIAHDVEVAPDGHVFVTGVFNFFLPTSQIFVSKLDSAGVPDPAFAGDWILELNFSGAQDVGYAGKLDAAGRVLVAGTIRYGGGTSTDMVIARVTSAGVLDGSFNAKGWIEIAFNESTDYGFDLAVDASGRPVMAGQTSTSVRSYIALARLTVT
jgi:uncharacterized delta-60 repeat protein